MTCGFFRGPCTCLCALCMSPYTEPNGRIHPLSTFRSAFTIVLCSHGCSGVLLMSLPSHPCPISPTPLSEGRWPGAVGLYSLLSICPPWLSTEGGPATAMLLRADTGAASPPCPVATPHLHAFPCSSQSLAISRCSVNLRLKQNERQSSPWGLALCAAKGH